MNIESKEMLAVPYACTVHGEEEIAAVMHVLKTSTQMGKHVRQMEQAVAALFAKKYGIMVNSGSSANYLAVEILNLPPGSEVITPALTFATTVGPIVKHQLVPAFVDVGERTFNMDATQVEALITPNTKAMLVPNLLGNLPDWKILREIASHYQLILIEDSADTLGALIEGTPAGQYSDISTTSFYGSHIINCAGNGGMLCVNEAAWAEKAILLRSWGRSSSRFIESEAVENRFNILIDDMPYDAKFVFETIGYNLEPSEMGAAFGLVQLKKLQNNIEVREHFYHKHYEFFSQYSDYFLLPEPLKGSRTAWLAFPLIVKENAPFRRTDLQIFLEKRKIQTRTVLAGNILRQPGFARIKRVDSSKGYPNADAVMRGGLLLGCHHGLNEEMVQHIHTSVRQFVAAL